MNNNSYRIKWEDIAFSSKKVINNLEATFIAAPRELSQKRLVEIIKTYLPKGNVVLGIASEKYILGFGDQPQFKTLRFKMVQQTIEKIWSSSSKYKVYILEYSQKNTQYIYEKLSFKRVVLINGSWRYAFHTQKPFYVLTSQNTPFEYSSPFVDETEARQYADDLADTLHLELPKNSLNTEGMLGLAQKAAEASYDYMFQTGIALGKQSTGDGQYMPLLTAYNQVVPYETYAMHHGAVREKHFSPPNDLNHYDTVHAESALPVHAQQQGIKLEGTTLFINLLPCPTCSRMLTLTPIKEIVYQIDHSDGYAVKMLEAAGKKVRRVVL